MKTPKFSILIPIYNAATYLHRCIDSILLQSFTDYELLLIDDGSRDESSTICDEYAAKDACVRVFHKENGGVSSARNLGLEKASGEWILFADADDYYYNSNVLQELSATIDQNPLCELLYFPGGVLLENGEAYQDSYQNQIYKTAWDLCEEQCCKAKCLVFGAIYAQCFKRTVIEAHHLRLDNTLKFAEDRLFVLSYCMWAQQTIVLSNPMYCYVQTANSVMHSNDFERKKTDDVKCATLLFDLAQENKKVTKNFCKYCQYLYHSSLQLPNRNKFKDWIFLFKLCRSFRQIAKTIILIIKSLINAKHE